MQRTEEAGLLRTRRVRVGDIVVGDSRPILIAGPCAVEPDYVETAQRLARLGVDILRGCAFKPRTHPDSFQGMGRAGLQLVRQAREATGRPIVTEVLSPEEVPLVAAVADCLQIGSRNMQNFRLLVAAGESGLPVLLKRGFSATYDEWLAAAAYIERTGNRRVILCERGIRSFEPRTRNTLDLSAVPVMRELTTSPSWSIQVMPRGEPPGSQRWRARPSPWVPMGSWWKLIPGPGNRGVIRIRHSAWTSWSRSWSG